MRSPGAEQSVKRHREQNMADLSNKMLYPTLETAPLSQPQLISSDHDNNAINVTIDEERITAIALTFRNEQIQFNSGGGGLVVYIYNAETFEQDLDKEDYPGVDFFEFSKTELVAGKTKVKENTGSGHTTVQLYPSNLTTDKEYYILIIWERFSTRIMRLQA